MGIINFKNTKNFPVFRKVAMGTWRDAGDPSVYGLLEIDMTQALELINKFEKDESIKITPTHLVGKAIAKAIKDRPEINGMIRFNKVYYRENIDVFFQVNVMGDREHKVSKANLSGAVLREVDKLSLKQIAEQLLKLSTDVRNGNDKEFASTFSLFKFLPWCLSAISLKIFSFLNFDLNLNLSSLGLPKDPFGSVMITSVGGFGIEVGWAPLVPYSRVPLLLAIGAIHDAPIAINGLAVVRPIMKIGVTFDHRLIDGIHAAELAKHFKVFMSNPEEYL